MINLTAKIVKAIAVCVILSACGINAGAEETSPAAGLVARKDFNANREWQSPQVMGRDFWNILDIPPWACSPDGSDRRASADDFCFNDLKDTPVYKESGRGYNVQIHIFNKDTNTVTTSEILKSSWSPYWQFTAQDFFRRVFESTNNPNAPFFITTSESRPPWGIPLENHNYDFAGYEQWKKNHPNFMGFIQGEWCNECFLCGPWSAGGITEGMKAIVTKEQVENAEREFPSPATREEATAMVKKLCGIIKKYHFNDPEKLGYLRSIGCVDHYAYEWGASMNWLETTNSGPYRWQQAFFFARGAAHQYGKKWGWYLASYYNGYPADGGEMVGDSHVSYRGKERKRSQTYSWLGSDFGMSLSLYTRGMYLAYLTGPSFVQHEQLEKFVSKDGAFSPWGKKLEEWFDFTQKNKRGITYAPVALLIPFEQCYPVFGRNSWFRYEYERPDWMIDAFMYTIALPNYGGTRDGNEGCLSNSPYGDIYDAILPNTPEKPVSLDVLNKYKVAIMLGRYAKNKALADRLMEYVKEGGTLLININQLNEFFPESFTGVEKTNAIQPVKGEAISLIDNTKISLSEEYELEKINLKGAKPVLVDSGKNALACVNNYGKGRVIVTTVDYLVPKKDFVHGKDYPLPAYFLRQIVKDVLPLEVKGDIEYGLNKLDDGWLLYLINNKGVTKFVDKIQSVDPSKTAKVEVNLKDLKVTAVTELRSEKTVPHDEKSNSFKIEVPPGEIRIVKIQHP